MKREINVNKTNKMMLTTCCIFNCLGPQ